MDMDRGIVARIDRKLLAGLCDDEALRTLRVPANGAKWSTWKRYCDSVGVSMGRAVATLMDREVLGVFGEHTAGEWPVLVQLAVEVLENREAEIVVREREVDTTEARMRERSERVRRWEDEIEARELRVEAASKCLSSASTARTKIGRNERCPCGSGLKYKRCHGLAGRRTYCRICTRCTQGMFRVGSRSQRHRRGNQHASISAACILVGSSGSCWNGVCR